MIRWLAALLVPAMLLTGPQIGAQNKVNKDLDKDKDKTKEVTSEKMIRMGVLVGKVAAIYEDKRMIRLQVTVPVSRLNPGALLNVQQAQLQMAQARARRDPVAMRQAQISLAMAQASLYTVERINQDVELQALDEVVVRTASPRQEFDEKGKIKRLTRAELKEMKGDPKMPGFKAEFGDVTTDQIVQVSLVKKKPTGPVKKAKPKPKGKAKDGDAEPVDLLGENLPQISMIMILMDPPPGG
jgi:hypothetical protein